MAQGLSTPDPSHSLTHLSIRRGCATTTHCTHHQISLMASRNTTIVPLRGLHIGPACEAGLSTGMQRERVPPQIRKKKEKEVGSCIIIMEILHVIVMFPIVTFCANIYTELVYYW